LSSFPAQKSTNSTIALAGVRGEEIKPQASATQLIFHIHGGAFFLGSLNTHRAFMTDIAARTQMQVIHVDYPLHLNIPILKQLMLFDVYQLYWYKVSNPKILFYRVIHGANLALALCLRLKEQPDLMPSGLILMSPFLDLTLTSESFALTKT
jgi:acetyl esterase/lipase